jgi:NAD(P)-dependent dehydrogenase (short-subunit alcohol dehydrogenase family)
MSTRQHPSTAVPQAMETTAADQAADRVAVVTGASSGIGRAIAIRLAENGWAVTLVALPGDELEAAAEACRRRGAAAVAHPADLTDPAQVLTAFDTASRLGRVDAVASNAGMSIVAPLTEFTDEQWTRQLHVNLTSCFYVCREAARRMVPNRSGAIVTTASELAHLGQGGYVAYTATKGGVLSMSRALAAELAVHGIRVNSVSPGAIDTPLLRAEFDAAPDPAAELAENEASIALGRIGRPTEIADAVAFLLSDAAGYITGANLLVDGGRASCLPIGSISRGPGTAPPLA